MPVKIKDQTLHNVVILKRRPSRVSQELRDSGIILFSDVTFINHKHLNRVLRSTEETRDRLQSSFRFLMTSK